MNNTKRVTIRVRKERTDIYYFNDNYHYVVSNTIPLLDTIFRDNNTKHFTITFNSKAKDAETITLIRKYGFVTIKYTTKNNAEMYGIFCKELFDEYTKHLLKFDNNSIEVKIKFKFKKDV